MIGWLWFNVKDHRNTLAKFHTKIQKSSMNWGPGHYLLFNLWAINCVIYSVDCFWSSTFAFLIFLSAFSFSQEKEGWWKGVQDAQVWHQCGFIRWEKVSFTDTRLYFQTSFVYVSCYSSDRLNALPCIDLIKESFEVIQGYTYKLV